MNNSLKISSAFLLVSIILLMIGCAKDPTEPDPRQATSTFPLTTDSRWEYNVIWYQVPFNEPLLADTVTRDIYRHIIGLDSLPGIADLVVCDDTMITYAFGQVDTFINRQWLKLDDGKLKLYASDLYPFGNEPNPNIFEYPHNLLDFPLINGKSWIARIEGIATEDRRVAGIEYIELPFGWLNCDVIHSAIWDNTSNDTMSTAFEWYSDDGLMRAEFAYATSVLYDDGGVFLDSLRSYEIWELTEMDIRP